MSVISVTRGVSAASGGHDESTRTYTEPWFVLTSSLDDTIYSVLTATGLPAFGLGYPGDTFAVMKERRIAGRKGLLWEVHAVYKVASGGGSTNQNPLTAPPDLRVTHNTNVQPLEYSLDANNAATVPIVNTAGILLDVSGEVVDPVLVIDWNTTAFTIQKSVTYTNLVSSDYYYSQPGQARIVDYSGEMMRSDSLTYWKAHAEVHFRQGIGKQPDGSGGPARAWWKRVLNAGKLKRRTGAFGATSIGHTAITDENGVPVSEPVPLDKDGQPITDLLTTKPIFLEFKMFRTGPIRPALPI